MTETAAPTFASDGHSLSIKFTASGSEYFRIWIVNLLLTIVTLGFYYPFAKARRIQYFYANTIVDGHALAFHGNPWRMFRGYVLLVVLLGAYNWGGRVSPTVGLIAFCILAAIWPALWRASLQFRLGNTSWRGLRFRFSGDLLSSYKCYLPVVLPIVVSVAISFMTREAMLRGETPTGLLITSGLVALGTLLMAPWTFALLKRYQHGNYRYATQQTRLDVGVGSFYALAAKIFCLSLVILIVVFVIIAIVVAIIGAKSMGTTWVALLPLGAAYGLVLAVYASYATARTQNLVWNGTRSAAVDFESRLSARELFTLTLKNWLLTLITLGLYHPFAAVQTTRLRLSPVRIHVSESIDDWTAAAGAEMQDASGDAAADFFGFDVGL